MNWILISDKQVEKCYYAPAPPSKFGMQIYHMYIRSSLILDFEKLILDTIEQFLIRAIPLGL